MFYFLFIDDLCSVCHIYGKRNIFVQLSCCQCWSARFCFWLSSGIHQHVAVVFPLSPSTMPSRMLHICEQKGLREHQDCISSLMWVVSMQAARCFPVNVSFNCSHQISVCKDLLGFPPKGLTCLWNINILYCIMHPNVNESNLITWQSRRFDHITISHCYNFCISTVCFSTHFILYKPWYHTFDLTRKVCYMFVFFNVLDQSVYPTFSYFPQLLINMSF